MSFLVNLVNNSNATLTASTGDMIVPGGQWQLQPGATGKPFHLDTPMGRVGFSDIGDQHIPGDSGETWGVLIGYQEMSVVGRYEGGGTLDCVVDPYFQVILTGMDFRQVQLNGLVIG